MKMTHQILFLCLLLSSFTVFAEPLSYYEAFFDRENDITHDPEFPQTELLTAKSDIYQVEMTSETTGVALILSFSLTANGQYSFWLLKVDHRWRNNSRSIRFGKCSAYNGKWEYKDGKLFLGNDLILEAAYLYGTNMMLATFVDAKRPQGTENLEVFINDGSIDTIGVGPSADNGGFDCRGFSIPFWLPIPQQRPW